jgi:hypothetical protein
VVRLRDTTVFHPEGELRDVVAIRAILVRDDREKLSTAVTVGHELRESQLRPGTAP